MGSVEIPNWLEALPLAPEFRPTDTEFADPIAYISKIEKEAGAFGICKVIPPFPKPSKKYVFGNLNKSLLKCPELGSANLSSSLKVGTSSDTDGEARAVFTTRQQELGQSVKKSKGVVQTSSAHKQVWQSGEIYTLEQFESKSRVFAKGQLGTSKDVSPLVIEAMFWKAALEKPMYLEYANDVPGSGFGEPEGQFRYFHRRRRKRNFFTRSRESSSCKTNEMDSNRIDVSRNDDSKLASCRNELCTDVSISLSSPPPLPAAAKEVPQSTKKRSQSCCDNKEGSAGWKISNSPWNLQVISRAPGSLTRFMPDDIPGVTSPMVYIGMLFSWFAWHVEDHELHSMNFLHTGASKTWYSVPGDYAFAFEEVLRTEAYGANIDRIASLALLGEKTTLMSPELAVASGIPCCRLVQNPGEFVVTFPRAYHIGFSHGFNCGEAANFGTPQWLKVAKEAAVRRAAMNYLPMLSHQQLLYLLTMSFVSRVPRSFLPGVRSSRLRDRQKEEKEFLVKKAFIEDILHENRTVSALLGKNSGYRAIYWNKGLLVSPSSTETVSPPSAGDTVGTKLSTEKPLHVEATNKPNNERPCLWDEMSLYLENLDDSYLGSDDLSCDFQVDSGTLPCVACGILGFPFMSVVQLSKMASIHLQHDFPETTGYLKLYSSSQILDESNCYSHPENASTLSNSLSVGNLPLPLPVKSSEGWNVDNKFQRPRSFCLEHAVEIVDLLHNKGGANVLVICHSDYKKIRAHATTIAEEIGCPFNYTEVGLDMASKEDMQLIELAIEDGEHKMSSEDWTSKLGINLRHCVKSRKNSASKQVQRALTLGGLFSNKCSRSDFSAIKWKIRRTRSKKMYLSEYSVAEPKSGALAEIRPLAVRKEIKKIIQYTRRRFKTQQGDSSGAGKICGIPATLMDREHVEIVSKNKISNAESSTSIKFSPITIPGMQTESRQPIEDESSKLCDGGVEIHSSRGTESDIEVHRLAVSVEPYHMRTESNVTMQNVGDSDELYKENRSYVSVHSSEKSTGVSEEKVHSVETDEACNVESEGHSKSLTYPRCAVPVDEKLTSCNPSLVEGTLRRPMPIYSAEEYSNDMKLEEAKSGTNEQPTINEVVSVSTEVNSEIVGDSCAELTSDHEPQKKEGTSPGMLEGFASCLVTRVEVQTGNSHQSDVVSDVILGDCSKPEAPVENGVQGSASLPTETEEPEAKDRTKEIESVLGAATAFRKYSRVKRDTLSCNDGDEDSEARVETCSNGGKGRKRNRELERLSEESKFTCESFTRSPCEGLRPRRTRNDMDVVTSSGEERPASKKTLPTSPRAENYYKKKKEKEKEKEKEGEHRCDIESCAMSFGTKRELSIHKGNRCPHEGCGKKFRTHKYAAIHHRVHFDDRPLKCPWEGCSMAFKWAWARTEHIRVHTGEKPYKCTVQGCGLSFRFVSDFSRHRRKTGHNVDA